MDWPRMTKNTNYQLIAQGEEHRCGGFPKPTTFDQYIICGCGTLFRSDIKNTYREDEKYVYLWAKATKSEVNWSISQGRLDPTYKYHFKKQKKKWWESL